MPMDESTTYDVVIVGAGITGATLAERCASRGWRVCVLEKRNHIGGNVYDYIDLESGIRVSKYGAHIFHTNDEVVWDYIHRFSAWKRWDHRVIAYVDSMFVPIPVNRNTINSLKNIHLQDDTETHEWLSNERTSNGPLPVVVETGRDAAIARVGPDLYEKLFRPYTLKQWAKDPSELDASVLSRIPVRTNTDDRYFNDRYQALPENGYTAFVQKMLDHPLITVHLETDFEHVKNRLRWTHLIYTGPIDVYFKSAGLPPLEYRSIQFHWERYDTPGYYQPNSVVNYPSMDVQHTRIVEYKHFLHQFSHQTIIAKETTTDVGEPYYPVPSQANRDLYEQYRKLAEKHRGVVHFVGRLASYKYFNMDQAIRCALDYFDRYFRPLDV
jgi:UDP-galactopyranose mutase